MKNIRFFLSEQFQFLEAKFSIYMNRCVFVMKRSFWYQTKHRRNENSSLDLTQSVELGSATLHTYFNLILTRIPFFSQLKWDQRTRKYFLQYVITKTLRKHAYSNILKIVPPKNENFQMKNSDIFHISAQNIDCGYSLEPPRRGGSNE